MTLAVDTSAWIEVIVGSVIGQTLLARMPERADCVMPTIVQLELAKWLHREFDEARASRVLAFTTRCNVIAMDTAIALWAATLCRQHRLPTADSIVYATALSCDVRLLTCDSHFEGLPGVIHVGKSGLATI